MPSAREAPGDGDTASDESGGAAMGNETASRPLGVDERSGGSGGSVTTHRAKVLADNKVELLLIRRIMSVPSNIINGAVDRNRTCEFNDIVTVTLSADKSEVIKIEYAEK